VAQPIPAVAPVIKTVRFFDLREIFLDLLFAGMRDRLWHDAMPWATVATPC
jgi:hypothetical protein